MTLHQASDESKIYAALDAQQVARAASSIDNPLEAELFLLKARLDFIDLAGALHHFDAEAVFAYGLIAASSGTGRSLLARGWPFGVWRYL